MTEEEILLTSILNCSRANLYTRDVSLDAQKYKRLLQCLSLRSRGFPLQYILGEVEFFGLVFKVDRRVFIPRPETEILVETVLEIASSFKLHAAGLNILDIGTGSGNISISLAKFLKDCRIIAVDISKQAIVIAKNNAVLNDVEAKVSFIEQDLFDLQPAACSLQPKSFDFIVSNPPYIPKNALKGLQREIRYEPQIALDGGDDGLDFYLRIIKEAPKFLNRDGLLLMEMGFGQCPRIKELIRVSCNFEIMDIIRDYNGIERVMVARLL